MGSILRPFHTLLTPGQFQVPTGNLAIDRSHPLANGLIAYFLPGVSFNDVAANSFPLIAAGAVSLAGMNSEGPGVDCTANNASNSLETTGGGVPGQVVGGALSVYCRGYFFGTTPGSSPIVAGLTAAEPNVSPFVTFWIQFVGAGNNLQLLYNASGTSTPIAWINSMSAGRFSLGGTIVNGGNAKTYFNGVLDTNTAGITVTIGNGGFVCGRNGNYIQNLACAWNRELTGAEMAWIHNDPYAMVIPAEYEMPVAIFVAPQVFPLMPQIVT